MGNSARGDCDSVRADGILLPVEVDQDLALQHIKGFVLIRMEMQGRRLALRHEVFEVQERAARLLGSRLHGQDPSSPETECERPSLERDSRRA